VSVVVVVFVVLVLVVLVVVVGKVGFGKVEVGVGREFLQMLNCFGMELE
jgi:hypothetical protein